MWTFVSRKYVSEIIQARLQEIFKRVDKELRKVKRSGLLPAGIVLVGAGAKLPGILELVKEVACLPAIMGYPQNVLNTVDKVNDVSFATAVGLVVWGSNWSSDGSNHKTKTGAVLTKVKGWFKNLLP